MLFIRSQLMVLRRQRQQWRKEHQRSLVSFATTPRQGRTLETAEFNWSRSIWHGELCHCPPGYLGRWVVNLRIPQEEDIASLGFDGGWNCAVSQSVPQPAQATVVSSPAWPWSVCQRDQEYSQRLRPWLLEVVTAAEVWCWRKQSIWGEHLGAKLVWLQRLAVYSPWKFMVGRQTFPFWVSACFRGFGGWIYK